MAVKDQLITDRFAIYNGDCVEVMQTLPAASLPHILRWLLALDYPWSSTCAVRAFAPKLPLLEPVLDYLGRSRRSGC